MVTKGVLALKVKSDKESLKTLAYQVAQITTQCVKSDIKIIDCIITFGGIKDFAREVAKMDAKKEFDYLLIYSPQQISKDGVEFQAFKEVLKEKYDIEIKALRS